MANPYRGEVDVAVDGATRTLRLTLGALAELEAALEAEGLVDLAERFERGGVRAGDVIAVLAAGFRGAGAAEGPDEVARMSFGGGAAGAARAAARLLSVAFTGSEA
jgi:hypothetical protein